MVTLGFVLLINATEAANEIDLRDTGVNISSSKKEPFLSDKDVLLTMMLAAKIEEHRAKNVKAFEEMADLILPCVGMICPHSVSLD